MNCCEGPILPPTDPKFPTAANWLRGTDYYSLPPTWRWSLGIRTVTPGAAAVAAQGKPGSANFIAAKPAAADVVNYQELQAGNDGMTADQWAAWTTQPEDPYVLQCVAAQLGVTLAPTTAAAPAKAAAAAKPKAAPTKPTAKPATSKSVKSKSRK